MQFRHRDLLRHRQLLARVARIDRDSWPTLRRRILARDNLIEPYRWVFFTSVIALAFAWNYIFPVEYKVPDKAPRIIDGFVLMRQFKDQLPVPVRDPHSNRFPADMLGWYGPKADRDCYWVRRLTEMKETDINVKYLCQVRKLNVRTSY